MIDIGVIAFGPELQDRPILHELSRLGRALSGAEAAAFEIAFIIPGSLGRGESDSEFEVVAHGGRRRRVQVFVVVPADVIAADDPMAALMDLARSAVEIARTSGAHPRGGGLLDYQLLLSALDAAEAALVPSRESPSRSPSPRTIPRHVANDGRAEAGVVVQLLLEERTDAMAAARDLEDDLARMLEMTGAGYVDGNQIGQGVVEIFAYGPVLADLDKVVVDAVRSRWGTGATLRLLDGGDEVDLITL